MRTAILATSVLLGTGLAHGAAASEWEVVQVGENFDVIWSVPRDNIVGGGAVGMSGGGDDMLFSYADPAWQGAPVLAEITGGGDDMSILRTPAPDGPALAARATPRPERAAPVVARRR